MNTKRKSAALVGKERRVGSRRAWCVRGYAGARPRVSYKDPAKRRP